jgi:hypothetical protein
MRLLQVFVLLVLLGLDGVPAAHAGNKKAFIVGIDGYVNVGILDSAIRDATEFRRTLVEDIKYDNKDVTLRTNLSASEFWIEWKAFLDSMDSMTGEGLVVFYYAGHGVQLGSSNYLLPKDLPPITVTDQTSLRTSGIDLNVLLEQFGARQLANPKITGLFIIDACRDNPFNIGAKSGEQDAANAMAAQGLGPLRPPTNVFVMYAAGVGQKALDGGTADNSIFIKELLAKLREKEPKRLDFAEIAQRIRFKVSQLAASKMSGHVQTPAYYDQLLYRQDIDGVRSGTDVVSIAYDNPEVAGATRSRSLGGGDQLLECAFCPEMAVVPAGANGKLQVSKPLAVGKHEITNAQWNACAATKGPCAAKPMYTNVPGSRPQDPVTSVSWQEARDYATWLSGTITAALRKANPEEKAVVYRLPTENEWEYSARAGSTTDYAFGNREEDLCTYANGADQSVGSLMWVNHTCSDGVGRHTAPAGSYKPNRWNLHDMHGNVWEWTADCAPAGSPANCKHSARGGSWRSAPASLRSDARQTFPASLRRNTVGFRLVRELQ